MNRLAPKCHPVGDQGPPAPGPAAKVRHVQEVPDSAQREPIHHPRLLPTHLHGNVLKFPFSGSNTWSSTRANPKPMVNTARVRMKRRVTPNTAAQALNLLAAGRKGMSALGAPLQKQLRVGQGLRQDPGR